MIKKKIFVRFTSCWSAGSGFGDGYVADSMVLRDSNGFPAMSGRALKGALREGAHRLSQCREDLARAEDAIFGTRATASESNDQGAIRVSAATLPESIRRSVSEVQDPGLREDMISDLYGQKTEPIQITVFQPLTDRPSDSKPAGRSLKTRFAKV